MRFLLWLGFWLLSFGTADIDVRYRDGLHIHFKNVWRRPSGSAER